MVTLWLTGAPIRSGVILGFWLSPGLQAWYEGFNFNCKGYGLGPHSESDSTGIVSE
jgi:hypothetical protein